MIKETPIIAIFKSGKVAIGPGCNLGVVLQALDMGRDTVMGIVLKPLPEEQTLDERTFDE